MTRGDTRDTGIPTRAIHEAYLGMQQAHRSYRQARDDLQADERQVKADKKEFQQTVLTYHELLRPHLVHESGLSNYWHGELPPYSTEWDFRSEEEAIQHVRDRGTGVYQVQVHPDVVEVEQQTLPDGGIETYEGWHDFLGLSWDTERLLAIQPNVGGNGSHTHVIKKLRAAVVSLKELDYWRAKTVTERRSGDGFMSAETRSRTRQQFEPERNIVTAKRLLVEATDKLGLLSDVNFSEPIEAGGKYEDALDPDVTPKELDRR